MSCGDFGDLREVGIVYMPQSEIPFGSELSPSQIDLLALLEPAEKHAGDWKAFEQRIASIL